MRETVWMIMQKAFSFYGVHSNIMMIPKGSVTSSRSRHYKVLNAKTLNLKVITC